MQNREEVLQTIIRGLRRGDYYSLLGPRYSGKTLFLQKLIERVEKDDFIKCIYWEPPDHPPISKSKNLYHELKLSIKNRLKNELKKKPHQKGIEETLRFIEKEFAKKVYSGIAFNSLVHNMLNNSNYRFVLILNRLHLLPKHVIRSILMSLRVIYNVREEKTAFKRFNVIISGISNLLEFTSGEKSPFNISHPLSLSHLTHEEAKSKLTTYSEFKIYCTEEAQEYILTEFNNHPYFINTMAPDIFKKINDNKHFQISLSTIKKYIEDSINEEVNNLQDKYLTEMVKKISEDKDIFEIILKLINEEEAKAREPEQGVSKYFLSGAMIFRGKKLEFTNQYIKRFLSRYLNHQTKGDIYLHFGEWEKALMHYRRLKLKSETLKNIFNPNRLEQAVNAVVTLINKCFEEQKIWDYYIDTLYLIFQLDSVEVFEKVSENNPLDLKLSLCYTRNGRRGKHVIVKPHTENLVQYALESGNYVVSESDKEFAFPIKSWDEKKQWVILMDVLDSQVTIPNVFYKILDRFIRITVSALDRARANYDIYEMLGEEVTIIDRDFNILYMNKARRDKYGIRNNMSGKEKCYEKFAGHISSTQLPQKKKIPPCPNCPAKDVFDESEKTGQIAWRQSPSACLQKTRGKKYYLLQTSLSLRDEYGQFTRALNIARDITKIQKTTDLVDEIFQIQQNEDLSRLLSSVVTNLVKMGYDRVRFYEYFELTADEKVLILKNSSGMRDRDAISNYKINIKKLGLLKDIFLNREEVIFKIKKEQFPIDSWDWIDKFDLDDVDVLFVPIYYLDRPFGLLALDNKYHNNKITQEDTRMMSNLTRYIIASIQNILFARNQKILFQITSELHNDNTLLTLLPHLAETIVKKFNVRVCSIFLYNRYKNLLVCNSTKVFWGNRVEDVMLEETYQPKEAISGKIYANRVSEIINDLANFSGPKRMDYIQKTEDYLHEKIRNVLFVPIISEAETMGIIRVCNKLDEKKQVASVGFKFDEKSLLENIGKQVGLAVSKIQTAHGAIWQRNIISSTLRTIQAVETQFLEGFGIDSYTEDEMQYLFEKVYFIILTGLTIKSPFGFNRAVIFREEGNQLQCKRGIGPSDEAMREKLYSKKIWQDLMAEDNLKPYDDLFEKISSNYDHYQDFYASGDKDEKDIFFSTGFNELVVNIPITQNDEIGQIYQHAKKKPNYYKCVNHKEYQNNRSQFLSTIKAFNWLILPLLIDNKPQGLIFVDNKFNGRTIEVDDIESLEGFLDRISITLGKLEALKNQIYHSRSQASLFKIMKAMTENISLDKTVEIIESELRKLIPTITYICLLRKTENGYQSISNCLNKQQAECKNCERADRECLAQNEEYYCSMRPKDDYFKMSSGDFLSRFLIKLEYDGEDLGILDVDSRKSKAFSENDLQILRTVAKQLSIEMIKAKVRQEQEKILKEREVMLREKEAAFSEIAHEMKTPLIGVKDLSLNVVDFKMSEEELKQNLDLMANEADKALNFTNQILDLTYLEHSSKPFIFVMKSIHPIVLKAIDRNKLYATTKNIRIDYRESSRDFVAAVEEENIIKAFSNIINNAIKYSKEDNKIIISLEGDNENVYFIVQDFGHGIPKADEKSIFEKHKRGKYAEQFAVEGIGIGLTIANLVVQKHNGTIHFTSKVHQGSTFKIQLPKNRSRENE